MRVAILFAVVAVLLGGCSPQTPLDAGASFPATAPVPRLLALGAPRLTPHPPIDLNASYAGTQPGPIAANAGSISGLVDCPCDGLPAQDVYAISTDGGRFYATQTVQGQTRWTIRGVPAGPYYVYAVERVDKYEGGNYDSSPRQFQAAYTVAIACGLGVTCTDHSPIAVVVRPGADSGNVETADWYSTGFPLVPRAGPAAPFVKSAPASFASAGEAAAYQGVESTDAPQVAGPSDCPVNLACFWLVSSHMGQGAGYYIAMAGANGGYTSCGLYVIGGGSSWQRFAGYCRVAGVFPAVGAAGVVRLFPGETGCINVYVSPSLSGGVAACLAEGTAVRIDDGPVYTGNGSSYDGNAYWWHLASRGWMVHQNLLNV